MRNFENILRKGHHISIVIRKNVNYRNKTTGFECIEFTHRASTRLDLEDIDITTKFLNKDFKAPLLIGSMTGGFKGSEKINRELARAASTLGIGMGVGSQRVAIENPNVRHTFSIVREEAPDIFVMANLGASQLAEYGVEGAKEVIDMINADALAVHFNPVHEAVQVGGTPVFSKYYEVLSDVVKEVGVPVIVKEVGFGMSMEDAKLFEKLGVSALQIDGAGGTSWAAVEYYRALLKKEREKAAIAKCFWDWGIPTAISLLEVTNTTSLPVIAGGGIRSGIDVAKSISIGASLAAIARPVLITLIKGGVDGVVKYMNRIINELKVVMLAVEARNLNELKNVPIIVSGWVRDWLSIRGINVEKYARRRVT